MLSETRSPAQSPAVGLVGGKRRRRRTRVMDGGRYEGKE